MSATERIKEYTYGKTVIRFKRTTNKEISKISYKTALVIQAVKALGKENITDEIKNKIASTTTDEEKAKMFAEAKYATSWIYDVIKRFAEGQDDIYCNHAGARPRGAVPEYRHKDSMSEAIIEKDILVCYHCDIITL